LVFCFSPPALSRVELTACARYIGQFYAIAEQLFRRGAERAAFIRSMATWWLRLNSDFEMPNGGRLEDQVPEGTWDSYVDSIEDG
jgi:hypothetical protein